MSRAEFPEPIEKLLTCLKQLPGIGPRSAERMALWLYHEGPAFSEDLSEALQGVQQSVSPCRQCGFFTTEADCAICRDPLRASPGSLCIVEQAVDVLALERTGAFQGLYHVLGGRLSPLRHIGPDDLTIPQLEKRLETLSIKEVILALSNDVEGDATSNYLADLLQSHSVVVSRLAQGLPAGGGLDHADELTLFRALNGRTRLTDTP